MIGWTQGSFQSHAALSLCTYLIRSLCRIFHGDISNLGERVYVNACKANSLVLGPIRDRTHGGTSAVARLLFSMVFYLRKVLFVLPGTGRRQSNFFAVKGQGAENDLFNHRF